MRKIFITGIGTDVGKTVVSAIVTEALQADYWKPIQTGSYISCDADTVRNLISNTKTKIHPEVYKLEQPLSPHAAAELENVKISLSEIELPKTDNTLVIEGAGGIMVPLNDHEFILDIIKKFNAETILVIQNYLGSINHSLLSIDCLKKHQINILGIIFNGPPHKMSEDIIKKYSQLPILAHIGKEPKITPAVISKYASQLKNI
ncbi:MAG: dethiobiotin synthase [Bacteroidia bacterium]